MARKIWRYTLTSQEQKLWDLEEMQGWRVAFEKCVEDDARDQGYAKYIIYDNAEKVLISDAVEVLPEIEAVN